MPMPDVRCPRCGQNRLILRVDRRTYPDNTQRSRLARLWTAWRTRSLAYAKDGSPSTLIERRRYVCELCGHTWCEDVPAPPHITTVEEPS